MSTAPSPTQFRNTFEAKVRNARNGALLIVCLHLLSRFLSLCALTWAAVVLLGGFASTLRTFHFFLVIALLILEGARLFVVQAFGKFSSKTLFRESHYPEEFEFKDTQYIKGNRLDLAVQAMSSLLALVSLISIALSFIFTGSQKIFGKNSIEDTNLRCALYIFYMIVMVNSFLAVQSSLLRPFLRSKCDGKASHEALVKQNCLVCYHDEVYKMAMHVGILEAAQLDILEFAYAKLSSDYKRNIRPPLIKV